MAQYTKYVALLIVNVLAGCDASFIDVQNQILQDFQGECSRDVPSSPTDCFTSNWYIPHTLSDVESRPSTRVGISQTEITLNGTALVSLESSHDSNGAKLLVISANNMDGLYIPALGDALVLERNKQLAIERELQIPDVEFRGDVVLSIDQTVPFQIIRNVMMTAGQSQYNRIYFSGYNPWLDELRYFVTVLPAISSPILIGDQEEILEFQLKVNVVISDGGLEVVTSNANERPLLLPSGERQFESITSQLIPCTDSDGAQRDCTSVADYDWDAFNHLLIEIRLANGIANDYPILIEPHMHVSWDVISRTIDSASYEPFLEFGADLATWQEWSATKRTLFNIPVIHGGM